MHTHWSHIVPNNLCQPTSEDIKLHIIIIIGRNWPGRVLGQMRRDKGYGVPLQWRNHTRWPSVEETDGKRGLETHAEHCFPAPSSKLCQNWLRHRRGTLYLRAAVHRRGQRPPKGLILKRSNIAPKCPRQHETHSPWLKRRRRRSSLD